MFKSKFAIAAVIALILSLLQPTGAALSASNVTKSFTVTKSDGTPYAGVSVALLGWDDILRTDIFSPLVTTNGQGQASIAVSSEETRYYGFAIQPTAGDYSHAVNYGWDVVAGTGQSFSVKMKPANLVVELRQATGQSAAQGSWVSFPGTGDSGEPNSFRPVIRSGPIPIDIGTDLVEGMTYPIRTDISGVVTQFGSEFGLKMSRVNGVNTPTLYSDTTATTALVPRVVSGVRIYD